MPDIGASELLLIGLVFIWPCWRIFSKAGFPGWYSLSLLVPLLNVIALFYLAFAKWPAQSAERAAQGPDGQVT